MLCTMSRLRGSIEIGPHGLSHFMLFMAATTASGLGVAIVNRLSDGKLTHDLPSPIETYSVIASKRHLTIEADLAISASSHRARRNCRRFSADVQARHAAQCPAPGLSAATRL